MKNKKAIEIVEDNRRFGISNELARMPWDMSLQAEKVLMRVLSEVNFVKDNRNKEGVIEVTLPLSELMDDISFQKASKNHTWYRRLCESLKMKTITNKVFETEDYIEEYIGESFFKNIIIKKHKENNSVITRFIINPIFYEEIQLLSKQYKVFKLSNTLNFTSQKSLLLYRNLYTWIDDKQKKEYVRYTSTKQLKEIFNLGIDDYTSMRKGKKTFNRKTFETKTLDVALSEINTKTNMRIKCTKAKKNSHPKSAVIAYIFQFYIEEDKNKKYEEEKFAVYSEEELRKISKGNFRHLAKIDGDDSIEEFEE